MSFHVSSMQSGWILRTSSRNLSASGVFSSSSTQKRFPETYASEISSKLVDSRRVSASRMSAFIPDVATRSFFFAAGGGLRVFDFGSVSASWVMLPTSPPVTASLPLFGKDERTRGLAAEEDAGRARPAADLGDAEAVVVEHLPE